MEHYQAEQGTPPNSCGIVVTIPTDNPRADEGMLEAEPGRVCWYSSEEDGWPDVGLTVGLGDGKVFWIGERTNSEGGGVGILIYEHGKMVENATLGDFDEVRNAIEFHIAPALTAARSHGGM